MLRPRKPTTMLLIKRWLGLLTRACCQGLLRHSQAKRISHPVINLNLHHHGQLSINQLLTNRHQPSINNNGLADRAFQINNQLNSGPTTPKGRVIGVTAHIPAFRALSFTLAGALSSWLARRASVNDAITMLTGARQRVTVMGLLCAKCSNRSKSFCLIVKIRIAATWVSRLMRNCVDARNQQRVGR